MSETEIPADIRAAAAAVIDQYDERGMLDAIAAALLTERRRCARIVETWAQDHLTVQPSFTKMAAAIRGDLAQELVDQAQKLKMGYE